MNWAERKATERKDVSSNPVKLEPLVRLLVNGDEGELTSPLSA